MLISYGHEVCESTKLPINIAIQHNSLHFVFSGKGKFNGITLGAGDIFLCKQHLIASYECDVDDPWTYGWINILSGDDFDNLIQFITFNKNMTSRFDLDLPYEKCLLNHQNFQHEIMHKGDNSFSFYSNIKSSVYYSLLSLLASDSHRNKSAIAKAYKSVDLAVSLIEQNYMHPHFTIESLTQSLHISISHLRNLFMEKFSLSPQQYLIRMRMEISANMLRTTDYPITLISASVGYNDPLYFSKMFRKHFGASPSQYAKKFRAK